MQLLTTTIVKNICKFINFYCNKKMPWSLVTGINYITMQQQKKIKKYSDGNRTHSFLITGQMLSP